MKVLHIALKTNISPNIELVNALKSLGEYHEINWMPQQRRHLNDFILSESKRIKPDFTFMQIQEPNIINPEVAKQIGGFVVNWTGDVRQPTPDWYFEMGKNIDLTLFTNTHDVKALKKAKIKADYLQVGFSHHIYLPDGSTNKAYPPIVFMANNYGDNPSTKKPMFPLSQERRDMVSHLRAVFGRDFQVYGHQWNKSHWLSPEEEAIAYRSAKIGINQNHYRLAMFSSDRLLRIMGSGTFCLSYKYPGIEKEYKIGKHLDVWENFDDLREKIDYYLGNDYQRTTIARAGCEYVHKHCTWQKRIDQMKKMIR